MTDDVNRAIARTTHYDTRCRGKCGAQDRDRTAWQSPAVFTGKRDAEGRLIPACPCCQMPLVPASEVAHGMDESVARARFDTTVVPVGGTLWIDRECLYDVVTLKSLRTT